MLMLVSSLLDGFVLAGLLPAVLASLVASVASWFATSLIGPSGRIEVFIIEGRR